VTAGHGGVGPRPVGESLGRVTAGLGMPPPPALGALFGRWDEVVGPAVAAHARPRSLRGGTLVVVADDPAWAAQLRWLEAELLRRIEAVAGPGVCHRVEVRVGGTRR
jgi:predicted nucleic acid-binding Zn ribbon protein